MKRVTIALAALCVLIAPVVSAGPPPGKGNNRSGERGVPPGLADKPYGLPPGQVKKMWRKGERIPSIYIGTQYYIAEPRAFRLAVAPRGHRWVMVDGDAYLVIIASGLVADVVIGAMANRSSNEFSGPPVYVPDRDDRWRRRYARAYTYTDDSFYRDCRTSVDPGGVIAGALIGGLLGNAIGRDGNRGAATVAGVVIGGTVGAALTRDLTCEDRSYAYRTYYDGFSAGRPNSTYQWRNPRNGNYGNFRVGSYYNDPDGFRCANYTQQIFINGRPQAASGRACQQPDGTWAIVG